MDRGFTFAHEFVDVGSLTAVAASDRGSLGGHGAFGSDLSGCDVAGGISKDEAL